MSKYKDEAMELIETVAENSHHNATKPFGQWIDAKSEETRILLKKVNKMVEVENLLLDRLNIHNSSEGLAPISLQEASSCANCSRFDNVELDCPIMVIQGQGMFRQGPTGGPTQQGQPNFPSPCPHYYNTLVFNNNPSQHARFRRNNDQPYPPSYNGQQQHQQPYTNLRQSSFIPESQPQAYTQAPR